MLKIFITKIKVFLCRILNDCRSDYLCDLEGGSCHNAKIFGLNFIHSFFHNKVAWYRKWHHCPYRPHVHWGILFICLFGAIIFTYSSLLKEPEEVEADQFQLSIPPLLSDLVVLDLNALTIVPDAWNNQNFVEDILKKQGLNDFWQGDTLNSIPALGGVGGVGYKEDEIPDFQGAEPVVIDLDADSVYTSAADRLVDADGSVTASAGATSLAPAMTLKAMDLIVVGKKKLALCTDSLINPTAVRIDTNAVCSDRTKKEGTFILGSNIVSPIEVNNTWAFNDNNNNGVYDDGEDIFIENTALKLTYSAGADIDVYQTGGLVLGDALTNFASNYKFTGSAPLTYTESILVDSGTNLGVIDKQADQLTGLGLRNIGTAVNSLDIFALKVWAEEGTNSGFQANQDILLGVLTVNELNNKEWRLGGLAKPIPAQGQRIYVTADIALNPTNGATLNFEVPIYRDLNGSKTADENGDVGFFVSSSNQNPSSPLTSLDTFVIDAVAPTVSISSSISNQTNIAPIPLTVTFSEGVTDLTIDDFLVTNGSVSNFMGLGSVYTLDLLPLGQGLVNVSLPAGAVIDSVGNKNIASSPFSIIFDTVSPTVLDLTSTNNNGTYGSDNNVAIQITFSESVQVTGTPLLRLETGPLDHEAVYRSGTGTNILTFNYTVAPGDASFDLDYQGPDSLVLGGGTITDLSSNNASLVLPLPGTTGSLGFNKDIVINTVVPDLTPPGLIKLDSASLNSTYGPLSSLSLRATYSEPILSGGLTIILNNGVSLTLDNLSGSTLSGSYLVGPTGSKEDSAHLTVLSIEVESVLDASGNEQKSSLLPVGNNLGDNAAIVIDTTAPQLTKFNSLTFDGAYGPLAPIDIRAIYNEPIESGSLKVVLNNDLSLNLGNISTTRIFNSYIVGPTGSLEDSADLTVQSIETESVLDASGNEQKSSLLPVGNNLGDNKNILIDTSAPILTENIALPASNDLEAILSYTFTSNEVGFLGSIGPCDPIEIITFLGLNKITFDFLGPGTYSTCKISVTDPLGNVGLLSVSPFTIVSPSLSVEQPVFSYAGGGSSGGSWIINPNINFNTTLQSEPAQELESKLEPVLEPTLEPMAEKILIKEEIAVDSQIEKQVPEQKLENKKEVILAKTIFKIPNIKLLQTLDHGWALGAIGDEVKVLQKFLNAIGLIVSPTGTGSPGYETRRYGYATRETIKLFQLKYGVVKNSKDIGFGYVGPSTRVKLKNLLKDFEEKSKLLEEIKPTVLPSE